MKKPVLTMLLVAYATASASPVLACTFAPAYAEPSAHIPFLFFASLPIFLIIRRDEKVGSSYLKWAAVLVIASCFVFSVATDYRVTPNNLLNYGLMLLQSVGVAAVGYFVASRVKRTVKMTVAIVVISWFIAIGIGTAKVSSCSLLTHEQGDWSEVKF